jgi:hypothetical protein
MKKQTAASLLSAILVLGLQGCSKPENADSKPQPESVTEPSAEAVATSVSETQGTRAPATQATPATTPIITTAPAVPEHLQTADLNISQEIRLAGGASLLVEENVGAWLLYRGSNTPLPLHCTDWQDGHFAVSPDLVRVVYFHRLGDHGGGSIRIVNVLEHDSFEPEFSGRPVTDYHVLDFVWLDNEILLAVSRKHGGSSNGGGDLFYYNITDGSSGLLIPLTIVGDRFSPVWGVEIVGDELLVEVGLDEGGVTFWGSHVHDGIPLSRIYDLIESGGTLTLPIPRVPIPR